MDLPATTTTWRTKLSSQEDQKCWRKATPLHTPGQLFFFLFDYTWNPVELWAKIILIFTTRSRILRIASARSSSFLAPYIWSFL